MALEIPREIRIVSKFGNVRGTYVQIHDSDLPEGITPPAYHARRCRDSKIGAMFLFRKDGCWVIAGDLDERKRSARICEACCASLSPTQIEPQLAGSKWAKYVIRIEPCGQDGEAEVPQKLEVHSRYQNLRIGFRKQPGEYLIWASDEGTFLWHDAASEEWKITEGAPGTEESRRLLAKAPDNGLKDPRLAKWSTSVDGISEVWWDEAAEAPLFWKDPEFPHTASSIGNCKGPVEWIMARDLDRDPSHEVLFESIDPTHLRQGGLGDCWLIAAASSVAHYPGALECLFPEGREQLPSDGKHTVRLFDVRQGKWVGVVVDEYIPCKKRRWFELHASPLFVHPWGSEIWVLLLEKAFAKLFGGYHKLKGGRTSFAWQVLTGCVQQRIISVVSKGCWEEYELDIEEQAVMMRKNNLHAIPLQRDPGMPRYNEASLWKYLVSCSKKGLAMAATIDAADNEPEVRPNGLVADHAYTIVQIVSISGFHLIELRNPIGGNSAAWNGTWGNEDKAWNEHLEVARELHATAADDGTFWMDFDDFFKQYDTVSICPRALIDVPKAVAGEPVEDSIDPPQSMEIEVTPPPKAKAPEHWGMPETFADDGSNCADRCAERCVVS